MSLLKLIEKDEATGRIAEIYDSMINTMGFVPNAFKIFSPSEQLLERQVANLGFYMRHKTLNGKLLALVRLLVSEQEHCVYCVGINTGILLHYGLLPDALTGIKADPSTAPLEPKDLAALLFVLKMVKDSGSITQADVDELRGHGWSDGEILEVSYHAAIQVGVDKIFNAFKIESDH